MNVLELGSVLVVLIGFLVVPLVLASHGDRKDRVISSRCELRFVPITNGGFDSDNIDDKDIRLQKALY